MNKSHRQGQILQLIKSRRILTQEQLAQELAAKGLVATQVTLSRDIRELGLVKTQEGYRHVESSAPGPAFETIASEFLHDAIAAQNLVVLKTLPGHANSLAIALDQEEMPEIVGTIAGDDTVLIITQTSESALALQDKLLGFARDLRLHARTS